MLREGTLGNISLRSTKPLLQRPEFEVVLSAARTAANKPLFDENPKAIFNIKPKMLTGRYTRVDSDRSQVAVEEQKGSQPTLDITVPMRREVRDAIVATWCLRVWHDTAESPQAKKDGESHPCRLKRSTTLRLITDLKLLSHGETDTSRRDARLWEYVEGGQEGRGTRFSCRSRIAASRGFGREYPP